MNKLAKIIESLPKEDLIKIKRDLVSGNIDRLVEKKLRTYTELNYSEKQCPICGGEIKEESYVLEFGASYLRRRAFFDAVDCLEYFINSKLKKKGETIPDFSDKYEDRSEVE
ncbi:MAG: hypothetical protein ACP5N2_00385 [Candidatus Nanoarchaeia archaeon]